MKFSAITFSKANTIVNIYIIVTLLCCIVMNIVNILRFNEFTNLRLSVYIIVVLSVFIISLYFKNYFTTAILILFNVLFWYYNITERKDLSWYDNPFNRYDTVLICFANYFEQPIRSVLYKIFSPLSLINNLLIWLIIIPFRIYKFFFNKNATS